MLLDDLLVAEDLAAAETTTAASHAAAVAASTNVQQGKLSGRHGFDNEKARQDTSEAHPDGAVVLGSPVAPPINGDMYTDISTENAMLQGQRYLDDIVWIKSPGILELIYLFSVNSFNCSLSEVLAAGD